jgi:chaperone BCS1
MIDFISHVLSEYNTYMNEIFGKQEFLISTITMVLVGIIGVILRYIPSLLWYQTKKHLTITVRIDSSHESYHNIMENLFKNNLIFKSRFFNIRNGRWGYEPPQLQLGEGVQFFSINGIPTLIMVSSREVKDDILYSISFTTFIGFGNKLLDILMKAAKLNRREKDKLRIVSVDGGEKEIIYQRKEDINKKVLTKPAKKVVEIIDRFVNEKDFYYEKGLTYKTGILLHGVPGSGKTSLIRALASKYDFDLYLIKSLKDLEKVMRSVIHYYTEDSEKIKMIVIEEIDNYALKRDDNEEVEGQANEVKIKSDVGELLSGLNLNDLLQNLDGIIQVDNVIIAATTNHIEKIDSALLRPGRFDHIIEFGYIDVDEFNDFLDFYYGKNLRNFDIEIKQTTPAELQRAFLDKLSFEQFVKKFVKNYDIIYQPSTFF